MPAPLSRRSDRGISLIEMVVAVLVLSIAVVGLFRVMDQATRTTAANRDRQLAGIVARNMAASLRLGAELPEQTRLGGQIWSVTHQAESTSGGSEAVTIRVAPTGGGPAAVLTTYRMSDTIR